MIDPSAPSPVASYGGPCVEYIYDKEPDGAVVITIAYFTPNPGSGEYYRPVLLDAQGNRYLPKGRESAHSGRRGGLGGVTLSRWRMDPNILPAHKVARMGIEAVTSDANRIAARDALERAKSAKIEVLQWPEVGELYPFTLTAMDGRKIRSEDLKGKVVVIDCWATWCSPCMALLPELKGLYEKWHQQGLEIVGVSLDRDVEVVQKICKSNGLTWPQVIVPNDEKVRALWQEASGISGIPRVLVLDQRGILRADSADKLEETIAKLLTNSRDKPSTKPRP
jgi:thiol-disulfide isomerase/thioredoxin